MKKNNSLNEDDFITVIPSHEAFDDFHGKRVVIEKLYFWHDNTFDHPINDRTINQFLLHVKMFGATVFPDHPGLGCLSINGDKKYEKGEVTVHQILYKGDVIYCKS